MVKFNYVNIIFLIVRYIKMIVPKTLATRDYYILNVRRERWIMYRKIG